MWNYGHVISSLQSTTDSPSWETVTARLVKDYEEKLTNGTGQGRVPGRDVTLNVRTLNNNQWRIYQRRLWVTRGPGRERDRFRGSSRIRNYQFLSHLSSQRGVYNMHPFLESCH